MARIESRLMKAISLTLPKGLGLSTRLALWKSRRDLARLDARALQDIGITPEDARREAQLTIWDVPETWRIR